MRDRVGRPLSETGDVGSNFKTSDSIGPAIVGYVPDLDRPVEGTAPIRFDFNESIVSADEQLDGDGDDDAAILFWAQAGGNNVIWQPLPVSMYLTRNNYSLTVDPVDGLELSDDTLLRKIVVSLLEDSQGNVMVPEEKVYRIRDANPPVIDALPAPPNAADGTLVPGTSYAVTPELSGIDVYSLDPSNPSAPIIEDLDRVEYFFQDPIAAGTGVQPGFVASSEPYAFTFVAAYSGNGVDPRPFPVWARAVDTSTNKSNVVALEMVVLPNQVPTIGTVTAEAIAPVAGEFYSGSTIQVVVSGIADSDDAQIGLEIHLWQESGGVVEAAPTIALMRPASGSWSDLEAPIVELEVPQSLAEGTGLFVRARATDASGADAIAESAHFAVADDQNGPVIEVLTARSADDHDARSQFYIGEELYFEFVARDTETEVISVTVSVDRTDIFSSPFTVDRVSGDEYRTSTVTVPVDVFSEITPVEVTVLAGDRGGNSATETFTFEVAPEPDPTAPTVEWLTPWEGGSWPADYTSQGAPGNGVALLLRVHARDLNLDEDDNPVPGTIVAVSFRGPEADGAGGLRLSEEAAAGSMVGGTATAGEAEYQAVWAVPDGIPPGTEIPFRVRVVDSGGLEVVRGIRLYAAPFRKVYEGVQTSAQPADGMLHPDGDPDGAVFLLDGTILGVYPLAAGGPRALDSLHLYSGGGASSGEVVVHPTVLTVPEITSYDSSVLYNPLDLEIATSLTVGAASRIDVSGRGLLGNSESDHVVLPGETVAETRAGGSHGGLGWFGSPSSSWENPTSLYRPSSSYGSVRDPHLPGAGGGGSTGSFGAVYTGAPGGGVARIDVSGGVVRLEGQIRADGGDSGYGAGAGGSVWLSADRIEGGGLITTNGGRSSGDRYGGGGGGRISIVFRELADDVDLLAQTRAFGGGNYFDHLAGAGTIYLDHLNPDTGKPTGFGHLHINNPGGPTAAATMMPGLGTTDLLAVDPVARTLTLTATAGRGDVVGDQLVLEDSNGEIVNTFGITAQQRSAETIVLEVAATEAELGDLQALDAAEPVSAHGRTRFSEVTAIGAVRLAFDDDLEVGPADDPAPRLNDPGALLLEDGARAILRGEGPELVVTTVPESGSEILVGATVEVSWTVSDAAGIWENDEAWPIGGHVVTNRYLNQPMVVAADPDPLVLNVPWDAEPGDTDFTLRVTDVGGRTSTRELNWTVIDNARPTGSLAFADNAPTTVLAGTSTSVVVHAEDVEGLASVRLESTGPAADPIQIVSASGTTQDLVFEVRVEPKADGSVPVVLQATIIDSSGASFTTGLLEVGVIPDLEPPTVTITIVPTAYGDVYEAGDEVTIRAIRSDNVGVGFSSLSVGEAVTTSNGSTIVIDWIAPAVATATAIEISAEVHDLAGNVGTATRTLTVKPHVNANPPVVTVLCPVDGDFCAAGVERPSTSHCETTSKSRVTHFPSTGNHRAIRCGQHRQLTSWCDGHRRRVRNRARCSRCGSKLGTMQTT